MACACDDGDFDLEVRQMWMNLVQAPTPTRTQHHPHGPDDAFRTIKHPHLELSGHDGIDEQDIVCRKWLVLMGILAWKLGKCG
jgi:hypothetical protein